MIFKRFESCLGISLPAWGRIKVELWYAPAGYSIKPHTHNKQDIKLIFLFGNNVRFHRRKKGTYLGESVVMFWRNIGRIFTIRAGDEHSFDVSHTPLIFLNIETWRHGSTPTSAADDIQFTNYAKTQKTSTR